MEKFRITWRHEIVIEAETKEDAKLVWDNANLGELNYEIDIKQQGGTVISHEFIEIVSFEDESYNDLTQ